MTEWHITIALFVVWVLLRLRRAWYWFGLHSVEHMRERVESGEPLDARVRSEDER